MREKKNMERRKQSKAHELRFCDVIKQNHRKRFCNRIPHRVPTRVLERSKADAGASLSSVLRNDRYKDTPRKNKNQAQRKKAIRTESRKNQKSSDEDASHYITKNRTPSAYKNSSYHACDSHIISLYIYTLELQL